MTKHSENTKPDTCDNNVLTAVFVSNYVAHGLKIVTRYGVNVPKNGIIYEVVGFSYKSDPAWNKGAHSLFFETTERNREYSNSYFDFKLVLKPLSDLIDNILEDGNDENYNLSCELAELLNTNDCSHFVKALLENKYYAVDVRLWNDIEFWLNKNHFDWKYNLIKKELAVSIHDVE